MTTRGQRKQLVDELFAGAMARSNERCTEAFDALQDELGAGLTTWLMAVRIVEFAELTLRPGAVMTPHLTYRDTGAALDLAGPIEDPDAAGYARAHQIVAVAANWCAHGDDADEETAAALFFACDEFEQGRIIQGMAHLGGLAYTYAEARARGEDIPNPLRVATP